MADNEKTAHPDILADKAPCSLPAVVEGPNFAQGERPDDSPLPASQGFGLDGDVEPSVTVLFFASAREATRTRRASFQSQTVATLIEQLRSAYGPGLELLLPTCAVWVNGSPAAPETRLQDGDEVAVLPPVSGGCEAGRANGDAGEKHAR